MRVWIKGVRISEGPLYVKVMYLLDQIRVELLVPGADERGGDVQSLPIQRELEHLRPSLHTFAVDEDRVWLFLELFVFSDLH